MPIPLVRLNAPVSGTYMPASIKFKPAAQWSRHSCLQFNKLVNTGPTPPAVSYFVSQEAHGVAFAQTDLLGCLPLFSRNDTEAAERVERGKPRRPAARLLCPEF